MRYFLIISLIILSACDLFETRDPENPESGRTNFKTPTTPEILFDNLKSSLSEKVVENYMACFVDSSFLNKQFLFIPSAGSVSKFSVLADWSLESERQYFNNVKSVALEKTPISLSLLNAVNNIQGDSAIYQFDYVINLTANDPSVPSIYQGSLKFIIYLDSRNHWVIVNWTDIKTEEQPSWSELKGRFY